MTRLSVWTVRTALLYLGVGFFLGALMLLQKGVPIDPGMLRLLPMHVEFVLLGWTLQLAMGIAFWILPRFSHEPRYGNLRLGWIAYVLLNVGVVCAGSGQWLGASPAVFLFGRLAELLAGVLFALHAWPRVRPIGL
jgi:heme/copper-type cytochrome/quinol oxidase subunit 1